MARQRIELGTLRGGVFEVPDLGSLCICCNGDTQGRTQDYDASSDRARYDPVPMPVCFHCKEHAMQNRTAGD